MLDGNFLAVERDLSRSIELAPGSSEGLIRRGIDRYLLHTLDPTHIASAHFRRAAELQYPYRYLPLWHNLAEPREVEALDVEQELLLQD